MGRRKKKMVASNGWIAIVWTMACPECGIEQEWAMPPETITMFDGSHVVATGNYEVACKCGWVGKAEVSTQGERAKNGGPDHWGYKIMP